MTTFHLHGIFENKTLCGRKLREYTQEPLHVIAAIYEECNCEDCLDIVKMCKDFGISPIVKKLAEELASWITYCPQSMKNQDFCDGKCKNAESKDFIEIVRDCWITWAEREIDE